MDKHDLNYLADLVAENLRQASNNGHKQISFTNYLQLWLEDYSKAVKAHTTYKADLGRAKNFLQPEFGSLQLIEVTRDKILSLRAKVKRNSGPYAANRLIEQLSVMFREAQLNGYYPRDLHLPTKGVKAYPESPSIDYVKDDAQMTALSNSIEQCRSKRMKALFWLYLLTGARCKTWRVAKWSWLDTENKTLDVPAWNNKNQRVNHIHLSDEALGILAQQPRRSKYIFPGDRPGKPLNYSSLWKAWDRVRRRAGLEHLKIHSLRHTFATWLLRSGYSLFLTGKMLNHASMRSTEVYAHLAEQDRKTAAQTVAKTIVKASRRKHKDD